MLIDVQTCNHVLLVIIKYIVVAMGDVEQQLFELFLVDIVLHVMAKIGACRQSCKIMGQILFLIYSSNNSVNVMKNYMFCVPSVCHEIIFCSMELFAFVVAVLVLPACDV